MVDLFANGAYIFKVITLESYTLFTVVKFFELTHAVSAQEIISAFYLLRPQIRIQFLAILSSEEY